MVKAKRGSEDKTKRGPLAKTQRRKAAKAETGALSQERSRLEGRKEGRGRLEGRQDGGVRCSTLVYFELKKLFGSRLASWGLCALCFLLFGGILFKDYLLIPRKAGRQKGEEVLEGRLLDEALLQEVSRQALEAGGFLEVEEGSPYHFLSRYVNRVLGGNLSLPGISPKATPEGLTEERFYETRREVLEVLSDTLLLTEEEREYWRQQEARIPVPFRWVDTQGLFSLKASFSALTILSCLLTGIFLSGLFAGEKTGNTWSLLLCTREGKGRLWAAKLVAGELAALGISMSLLGAAGLPHLLFGGLKGLGGAWQLIVPFSSYPSTAGQMLLCYTGLYLLISLLAGAFSCLLSLLFPRPGAVSASCSVLVLGDMFVSTDSAYRVLSQLRSLSPVQLMVNSSLSDLRLLRVGGMWLVNLQTAALFYVVALVLLVLGCFLLFRRQTKA